MRHSWRLSVCTTLLLVVTTIAFSPAFEADLLDWDTSRYVTDNKLLHDLDGLKEIWNPFSPQIPIFHLQYYPLVFTSYWIEYRLWGNDPRGYHATNVALHLVNTVLVLLLVRALGGSPWISLAVAAVFALHPTQVASVVWVAERKNTLSGLFYLISFLLFLRHGRTLGSGAYMLSLLAYTGGLLSKTQVVTLPVAIFLAQWLLQPGNRTRRVPLSKVALRLAPMLVLAVLASMITSRVEGKVIPDWYELPSQNQRPLLAANAAWFYIWKFLVPVHLAPLYPRWNIDTSNPIGWLGLLAWPVVLALIVRWRRRITPLPLWGGAQFLLSVAPALGLVAFAYQHFSYVGDHFLYLSCLGGGLALATFADRLAGVPASGLRRAVVTAAGIGILTGYAAQTYREAGFWRDNLSFFEHVLEHNPDCHIANLNVGVYLWNGSRHAEALPYLRRAYELRLPNSYEYNDAFRQYLLAVIYVRGRQGVIEACSEELERNPVGYRIYLHRAENYETVGKFQEALADYARVMKITREGSESWREAKRGRVRTSKRLGR